MIAASVPVSIALALRVDLHALAGIAGAVIGWLVEPDSDLHNVTTRSERRIYRLNPILGYLWEIYWYPLARAIPHGSRLSHLPPLCTIIRLSYIALSAWIAFRIVGAQIDVLLWLSENWHSARWAYWAFAWWVIQDAVHLAGDGWKRKTWRRKKKR